MANFGLRSDYLRFLCLGTRQRCSSLLDSSHLQSQEALAGVAAVLFLVHVSVINPRVGAQSPSAPQMQDTPADPHNARRGLFYSHIGWLMLRKNEHVLREGRTIDMSDIENDPMLRFHERYLLIINPLCGLVLPTIVSCAAGETWQTAVAWQCFIRYLVALHSEMTVNSLAHVYGYRPFNKTIKPTELKIVSALTLGEGWHNYHHTFPFDYKAAEQNYMLNFSGMFIDLCAKIGWAYDLKEASPDITKSTVERLYKDQ